MQKKKVSEILYFPSICSFAYTSALAFSLSLSRESVRSSLNANIFKSIFVLKALQRTVSNDNGLVQSIFAAKLYFNNFFFLF